MTVRLTLIAGGKNRVPDWVRREHAETLPRIREHYQRCQRHGLSRLARQIRRINETLGGRPLHIAEAVPDRRRRQAQQT